MLSTLILSAALVSQAGCPNNNCQAPYNPTGAAYSVPPTYAPAAARVMVQAPAAVYRAPGRPMIVYPRHTRGWWGRRWGR